MSAALIPQTPWLTAVRLAGLAIVVLLCAAPLLWAGAWLADVEDAASLWSVRQVGLLRSTLIMSLGAAAVAAVVGGGVGVALGYYRPKGARLLLAVVSLPVFIPAYILAMAWVDVFGLSAWLQPSALPAGGPPLFSLRGHGAAAFVLGLVHAPLVMLAALAQLRGYDHQGDEAARMHAGDSALLRVLVLPHVAPALGASAVLVALLAMINVSVPSLLQAPVYAVEVYTWFNTQASPARAVLQSLPLTAAGVGCAVLAWRALSFPRIRESSRPNQTGWAILSTVFGATGFPASAGNDNRCGRNIPLLESRPARGVAMGIGMAIAGVTVALPFLMMALRLDGATSFAEAIATAREEIVTSLLLGVAVAVGCVVLALMLMLWPGRVASSSLLLSLLPLFLCGPVFAVGFITFWNHAGPRALVYDGPLALVFVCMGKYLGLSLCMLFIARRAMPRDQLEAAAVHGAGAWQTARQIILPALAPTAMGAGMLTFVLAFGDVDATLLTAPPGVTPLGVRIYSLLHYGPTGTTAALSLLSAAIVSPIALALVWRLARRLEA